MKFQYASDLHLEFTQNIPFQTLIKPVAPILILAGDIGYTSANITTRFLEWCSRQWEYVFWIAGNHEYFNMISKRSWTVPGALQTIAERDRAAKEFCATLPNVIFLQGETYVIPAYPDYLFFGATLWTSITQDAFDRHSRKMADFKCIAESRDEAGIPQRLTLAYRNSLYEEHLDKLQLAIKTAQETAKKLIVITHHLPTEAMVPDQYIGSDTNSYYTNSLHHLMKEPIIAWICGHSHGKVILKKPIYCGLNARGYPSEQGTQNPYQSVALVDTDKLESKTPLVEMEEVDFH